MKIKQFKYVDDKGKEHEFTWNNEGFINATEAYKEWGKSQSGFDNWKTRTLLPYTERLIELTKKATPQNGVLFQLSDLIVVQKGGNQAKHEVGTWLHPSLVNVFSRWINMDFEIWCDKIITVLLDEGHVELDEQGQEYSIFRKKILNYCYPSSRRFVPMLRNMIEIHEEQGYNIKSFDNLMNDISKKLDKESRVPMYEKIIKVLEEMYQEDRLDMTTREAMKQRVYTRVIAVLKTRNTKSELKIKRFVVDKPEPVVVETSLNILTDIDVVNHNELVRVTEELKEAKEALELERKKSDGISAGNLMGDMWVPTLEPERIAASKIEAERTILLKNYRLIFSQYLESNADAKLMNPSLPDFSGEQTGTGLRKSVGVWFNENSIGFKLSKPKTFPATSGWDEWYKFYLFLVDDKFNWVGIKDDKTVCAMYNEATHLFMLYGVATKKL